jgi:hypothetical protein
MPGPGSSNQHHGCGGQVYAFYHRTRPWVPSLRPQFSPRPLKKISGHQLRGHMCRFYMCPTDRTVKNPKPTSTVRLIGPSGCFFWATVRLIGPSVHNIGP